jgi:hypothetical protein
VSRLKASDFGAAIVLLALAWAFFAVMFII